MGEGPSIQFLKIPVPVPDGSGKLATIFQTLHDFEVQRSCEMSWGVEAASTTYIDIIEEFYISAIFTTKFTTK